MANTVKLKKSSVQGKIPQSADLDYGELALNYADGKLYFKDSSNVIQLFGASSATDTLTNKTISSPTITGGSTSNTTIGATTVTASGAVSGSELTSTLAIGDEGGQINLAKPPNATIAGGVTIDVWQNRLRFFVQGGDARGAYIDLPSTSAGVGTNLLTGGSQGTTLPSQTGNAGKYLTTDGSNLSWAAVAGSGGFPVVDAGLITESINMSAMVDAGTIV
jgi:hypothetical protein